MQDARKPPSRIGYGFRSVIAGSTRQKRRAPLVLDSPTEHDIAETQPRMVGLGTRVQWSRGTSYGGARRIRGRSSNNVETSNLC